MGNTTPVTTATQLANETLSAEDEYPLGITATLIRENAYRIAYAADNVDFFGQRDDHIARVQALLDANTDLGLRLIQELREFWDDLPNQLNQR